MASATALTRIWYAARDYWLRFSYWLISKVDHRTWRSTVVTIVEATELVGQLRLNNRSSAPATPIGAESGSNSFSNSLNRSFEVLAMETNTTANTTTTTTTTTTTATLPSAARDVVIRLQANNRGTCETTSPRNIAGRAANSDDDEQGRNGGAVQWNENFSFLPTEADTLYISCWAAPDRGGWDRAVLVGQVCALVQVFLFCVPSALLTRSVPLLAWCCVVDGRGFYLS